MTSETARIGRHVLVVEDEVLIAAMLEDFLVGIGITVIGPAYSIQEGLRLIDCAGHVDAAILDVNVRGECIGPLAEELDRRSVPYALTTGYTGEVLDRWPGVPVLAKPYTEQDVAVLAAQLLKGDDLAEASAPVGDGRAEPEENY